MATNIGELVGVVVTTLTTASHNPPQPATPTATVMASSAVAAAAAVTNGNDIINNNHNNISSSLVSMTNTGSCGSNVTEDYQEFYETAQFVSGLIVYPLLCVVGITGNSLALVVLSHKDMATSTNVYLFGESTLFFVTTCILFGL